MKITLPHYQDTITTQCINNSSCNKQNDGFPSCPQTTSKIYRCREQKHKLKYALDIYFRNLLCRGVSDFRDVSINLQMYLEMALNDVFDQLDGTKRGRIMDFGFANSHYNGKITTNL